MNETRKKTKKIILKKNEQYEGQSVFDYLISSIEETNNQINNIHSKISKINQNNKKENITEEEKGKTNQEFNKVFKINNENEMDIFKFISDINILKILYI